MEQEASADNVKGCEGVGLVVSASDWGNWNETQGLFLRHFIEKAN